MKYILACIMFALTITSCVTVIDDEDGIVTSVKRRSCPGHEGKYLVEIVTKHHNHRLYTDELYSVGDTIVFKKK